MIKLAEVRKIFNQGRPNETVALRGINLEIQEAKLTVLKGPSGSGKTTLLSLIGCMTRPTSGRIWLCERELTSLPEKFLTTIRKETFGFVFQQFNLIGGISVLENVTLPAYPIGMPRKQRRERAMELLDRFSIANKAHVKVESLSGGRPREWQ
jgi:putative ABC transport system ATP-binding protein